MAAVAAGNHPLEIRGVHVVQVLGDRVPGQILALFLAQVAALLHVSVASSKHVPQAIRGAELRATRVCPASRSICLIIFGGKRTVTTAIQSGARLHVGQRSAVLSGLD
jgi:hypothetical protein